MKLLDTKKDKCPGCGEPSVGEVLCEKCEWLFSDPFGDNEPELPILLISEPATLMYQEPEALKELSEKLQGSGRMQMIVLESTEDGMGLFHQDWLAAQKCPHNDPFHDHGDGCPSCDEPPSNIDKFLDRLEES